METFRLCRELLDGLVLVDNSAISAAIKVTVRLALQAVSLRTMVDCNRCGLMCPWWLSQDVFNETRSILEPAGAVRSSEAHNQDSAWSPMAHCLS
jgi:threonine dehydratase